MAARELARAGAEVELLEARERLGGRIHTLPKAAGRPPIELGAEFIHGSENEVWQIVEEGKLDTHKVPDRHWRPGPEGLVRQKKFWDELEQVFSRLNPATPDQDFRAFIDQAWSINETAKKLALDYVEGFHAASADRMSVHALAKAEAAAERENATRAFRLTDGYGAMVSLLARELETLGVRISTETLVRRLNWEPGHVEAVAQSPCGERSFRADCAVVTLPLGVLQGESPSALCFEPGLPGKQRTIQGLAMGAVVKVSLQFRARFWPHNNFGFIHSDDRWFRTWWSDERGPVLTAWAGGPRAERLAHEGREAILNFALQALAHLLNTDCARIHDWLVASHYHDWSGDEFSRGAYSYTPVGMEDMPQYLAAPVKNTLFFAGEATDTQGDQGTVHGALRSGSRVAREIMGARLGKVGRACAT
jgi:monoamine oxidase